jgi:acyl-CoA thioesterase
MKCGPRRISSRAPVSFDDDTALAPDGDNRWQGRLAEGWDTPRGPLGGYVLALMLRGFELAVADPQRTARSVTAHFLRAPAVGPISVTVSVVRKGRSLSTLSGRLEQDGRLIALGLAAYSKPWESPVLDEAPMPEVEPPDEARPPFGGEFRPDQPPPFTQRLTMQHRFGEPPFSGADRAETGGWLGLCDRRPLDSLVIALLADAWFPAPWPRLDELAPAPTIDLTIHFRTPLPLPDSLLLGRFRTSLVRDGFFEEDGELWAPDGTLVAQSRQLALLLGARVPA